jgi:threo-3-hydroxy-L-aspartate ammonia-lyase
VVFDDVVAAAGRLEGVANRTPVLTSRTLDRRLGASAFLKCECFQRAGAFKFRGAYNAVCCLGPTERGRGVLTYSSGNHAQALALACRLLAVPVTVVMPSDAPTAKRCATEEYGARVITYDPERQAREEVAREIEQREGQCLVPPFDHEKVVAGQGTCARELLDEVGPLDVLLVPCGGGGLLSGSAIAARHLSPRCRVVGVEPELADDATRSFRSGVLQRVDNPRTVADGARTPCLGRITFPLVRALVDEMVTVSEAEIIATLAFVWERLKLVVEPTGVLGLAAALAGKLELRGLRVGVILSGGNVDLAAMPALLHPPPNREGS